jgi:large subunit ribosomal protein L9
MKLILTQEVTGLGTPGDIVEVKDGYARNFLLPGGEKQVASIRAARRSREIKTLDDAKQVQALLQARPVTLTAKAGANGRLFGAVTPADVAEAVVKVGGPQVDRRKVELPQAIKAVGEYTVHVRLHPEVQAKVAVKVVAG